jgi:hypothetical protein
MTFVRSSILVASALALFACNKTEKTETTTTTSDDRTGEKVTTTTSTTREHTGQPADHTTDRKDDGVRVGETTTTGVNLGAVNFDTASNKIVAARCDREMACKNVGDGKHFTTPAACTRELGTKLKDDLRPAECPNGVDAKHLDDCLTAIRKEACGNPIDTIGRISACNESGLCLSKDEKPSTK